MKKLIASSVLWILSGIVAVFVVLPLAIIAGVVISVRALGDWLELYAEFGGDRVAMDKARYYGR